MLDPKHPTKLPRIHEALEALGRRLMHLKKRRERTFLVFTPQIKFTAGRRTFPVRRGGSVAPGGLRENTKM